MSRVASSRVLKDSNGDIGEHLRNHIHLTNCIHLKNHMHNNNKQSPVLTDRSLLMRDLVVLQRSRSLRDPSEGVTLDVPKLTIGEEPDNLRPDLLLPSRES